MVAARCHVLLTLAQRRQLGCVFDPSSPEDLFLPKDMGEACANSFCVASASRGRQVISRRLLAS